MNPIPAANNRRSRLRNLALAATLGITSGMPAASQADDTEIYLGTDSLDAGIRPNVMFIVDTSGSMSGWVNGTGMDRLDNMKTALNQILDNATNVNVGLMRFSDPGGPVLFPVSYVDEDVSNVVNAGSVGVDVNSRINQGSDDAEESTTTGAVDVTSLSLDIIELQAGSPGAGGDIEVPIRTGNDDAEGYLSNGSITLTGNNFGLAYDDGENQLLGMRFDQVPLPAGATITSAKILFTAHESDSATDFTWRIIGERPTAASPNSAPFTTSAYSYWPSNREWTWNTAVPPAGWVDFVPDAWTAGNEYQTVELKDMVQSIIDTPDTTTADPNDVFWEKNNALTFFLYNPIWNGDNNRRRVAVTYNRDSDRAPVLRLSYTLTTTTPTDQVVGLRFRDVGIPQGATINSAHIEFRAISDATEAATVTIEGQDSDNAPTFTTATNDLTGAGRPRTSNANNVDWTIPAWSTADVQQTPDLKDMVQEIVNRGGWCGNNAMAFFIKRKTADNGPRFADSFELSPTNAPILRVDYDEKNVAAGSCIDQTVQRSVSASSDDAEETLSTGAITTSSTDLDLESGIMSAVRFRDLPISAGQTVLEASITFVSDSNASSAVGYEISGDAAGGSKVIEVLNDDLSDRVQTGAKVGWSPGAWTSGEPYTSPDLKTIVQEIIDGGNWQPGDAMTFLVRHTSGSSRRAETYDQNPLNSPVLRIKVRGPLQTGGVGVKTVRTLLKEEVDNLDHNGHTPIVDTLYEAANYFRGGNVHWGATRGHDRDGTYNPNPNASDTNNSVRRNTRISHPASWTGGTVSRDAGCEDENLNDDDCRTEKIAGASPGTSPVSGAQYVSPITTECQANYIILLTDGEANHNHSASMIKSMVSTTSCTDAADSDEECGQNLVKWMHETDQSPVPGKQTITTYTIGFNFSSDWLKSLATLGGGSFHTANTAAELSDQITAIFTDILNRSTSFAAPSLGVNAFNKLFHRADVYFSLFKPAAGVRWDGNVKKYQLCQSTDDGCVLGEVLDANANPAISTNPADGDVGRIKDSALSFWSGTADGAEIKEGGAGHEIPLPANRNVFTYSDTTAPTNEDLSATKHRIADTNGDGILDGLTGTETERRQRTQALLGDPLFNTNDQERADLIQWILSRDIDKVEEIKALADQDQRYAFNDPLHSSPVALTFGGTDADPVIKLFVGTNDGALRMLNADTGVEEWAFFPQSTLGNQKKLRENARSDHIYGLDGTPSSWVYDDDGDGIIEKADGDFVRIFIGMRRGGNNLYAFDVTPDTPLNTPASTGGISPTLMWRIEGGSGDFPRLAQTWSRPRLARMRFGTNTLGESLVRTVLVFGGGYDDLYDSDYGSAASGNAVYVVDPANGDLLFSISGTAHGNGKERVVSGMDFPIPSDIALLDNDSDGAVDRFFFGDLRANVWRVDLLPDLRANESGLTTVAAKLASLANTVNAADQRRIFYPPDVVRVPKGSTGAAVTHDLLVVTTGNRAHPLDETVQDRIYAIRDNDIGALPDSNADGLADGFTTVQGPLATPSTAGDLKDVTDVLNFVDDPTQVDDIGELNLESLAAAKGWYIDLEAPGEKSLAGPVILAGQLFATTYLPEGVINVASCSLSEGTGRLYGVNVLTGEPLKNWDGIGDADSLTKGDRVYALGGGIPSQAVPIFQEEGITLLVGGGGGATAVDPGIQLPRVRSYWYQEDTE